MVVLNFIWNILITIWTFLFGASPPDWPMPMVNSIEQWITISEDANGLDSRNEACFVMVNDVAVLIGGRRKSTVNLYDPVTRIWTNGANMPMELHHMQCVVVDTQVWVVTAWTGESPFEQAIDEMHMYDTVTNSWSTQPGLPTGRRRGAAAAVSTGDVIYVSHGNIGGHGEHSTTLGWLDSYDIATKTWNVLPDAPNPRDHTGAGVMPDGRICIAGGRNTGERDFLSRVVLTTDCFDPATNTWTEEGDLFIGAAGSAYGTTCDGMFMMAGGEDEQGALPHVQRFNGSHWELTDYLNRGRHGTSLAVDCRCNQIHVASGSGDTGGTPELTWVETLFPNGVDVPCEVM